MCIKHLETLGSCWIPQKLLRNIASGSDNGGIAYAPFKFQGPWILLRLNHFLTSQIKMLSTYTLYKEELKAK